MVTLPRKFLGDLIHDASLICFMPPLLCFIYIVMITDSAKKCNGIKKLIFILLNIEPLTDTISTEMM